MNWIPDNSKKGTFVLIICLLLLVFLRIGFYANNPSEYFLGNLLPELTGMCIELILIMVIVERWQNQNKIELLIVKEKRLREYLIFFLRFGFISLDKEYRVGDFYGEKHIENVEYLDRLSKYIKEHGLSTTEIKAIKNQCEVDLNTFGNLLPVASNLTDEHFKAWSRIIYFMTKISKGMGDDEDSIKSIISRIKQFENASHDNHLFVGAKNV
ncbi:hypothetical protein A1QO_18085 [Vibrio genomosp. F10 str. ZF-129]|uniref:DUF4760 domain-containing protein n=1 Tax=Vibrio genomosp. F10 str. ZF-129 TaxID=1187848 RepID=A0A1E5BI83_9VIBR|nr:hypothetical protein [Vibrio genomosp. F10]OEE37081.1 hypothetical protein A1QO_18085 [Vibrio genomosp. F10 str. ZF-129]